MIAIGRFIGLSAVTSMALFAVCAARAGDYARDPCAIPAILGSVPSEISTTFTRLAEASRDLDSQSVTLNARCDVQKVVGSRDEVACAKDVDKLSLVIQAHSVKIDAYHRQLDDLLQGRFAALQDQMAVTRRDLSEISVNAGRWQKEMEGWVDLGQEARNEALLHAAFAALDTVSEVEQERLKTDIALDENARKTVKSLYASGRTFIPKEFLAGLDSELLALRTRRDLLTLLQHLALTADRAYSAYKPLSEEKNVEGLAQFTAGILRESLLLMEASPEAKMTVTAFDMSVHSLYGWWARVVAERRVDQFAGLQEQQLRAVDALSRVYIAQIGKRKALAAAQNALHNSACYKSD